MIYVKRPSYLSFLLQNKDKETVKILNGLRGCGKTTILRQYQEALVKEGVPEEQIFYADLGAMTGPLPDEKALFRMICSRYHSDRKAYVLLDEVEVLPRFEQLADNLFLRKNIDLTLAGSGKGPDTPLLRKLLPGRCAALEVRPLSFKEFLTARPDDNLAQALRTYVTGSTLPGALSLPLPEEYMARVMDSTVLRDICLPDRTLRPQLVMRLIARLGASSGLPLSLEELAVYLGRAGRPLLMKTVFTAIDALTESGLFLFVPEGKAEETKRGTFYLADPGMLTLFAPPEALTGTRLLTHAAALELTRRFGPLTAVKTPEGIIPFTAEKSGLSLQVQFIPDPAAPDVLSRIDALAHGGDGAEKCILTLSPDMIEAPQGIAVTDFIQWLLK